MDRDVPAYIGINRIATELRYRPYNLLKIIEKWSNDPELPCPAPDAVFLREDGPVMLWFPERIPEWTEWNHQRIETAARRAKHSRRPGRPPKLGTQPK